jgi:KEOPS complex subunit Pcc1
LNWKAIAEIEIMFENEKQTKAMLDALAPEIKKPPTSRSKTDVSLEKNLLFLKIKADDIISLRASVNSHMRFLKAWRNAVQMINKAKNL